MTIKMKLKGKKTFRRNVKSIQVSIRSAVSDTNLRVARKIKNMARRLAPVYRGTLKKSIKIRYGTSTLKPKLFVGSNLKRAAWLEFGTKGQSLPPPYGKMKAWANAKGGGINPWALGRKIAKRGINKQPYLVPAFDRIIRRYDQILMFSLSRI